MDKHLAALLICLAVLLYAATSRRLQSSSLSLPLAFTLLGYALSGSNIVADGPGRQLVHSLAEITLVLVLFSDASRVSLMDFKANYRIPFRMLAIGMPLTILFGMLVAHFVVSPEAPWSLALLVAAILTPTDAALGQSVVTNPKVPDQLAQGINVESGLNDGFALPVVLIAAVLVSNAVAAGGEVAQYDKLMVFACKQIIIGIIAGLGLGWLTGRLLRWAVDAALVAETYRGIYMLASAFFLWLGTEALGGNGFIAAFAGGAAFSNAVKIDTHAMHEFMEGEGQLLTMLTFGAFGAVLLPAGLAHASVYSLLLAILFLTVVRMLPIWLSLAGLGLSVAEKLFLGWFGPRGLASVLFALMITERYTVPGEHELLACVVLTVALSIVLHGVSAVPLSERIGGWSLAGSGSSAVYQPGQPHSKTRSSDQ